MGQRIWGYSDPDPFTADGRIGGTVKKLKEIFTKIQNIISKVTALTLLTMIAVVFIQTFCRFVIFKSLSWSEEMSRYLFVVLIVLGVNLAITQKLFVRIEIIDNFLKGKALYVANIIRKSIMLFVNLIFVYSAYQLIIIGGYQTSPAMRIPMSVLYGIIFIGFILNVVAAIFEIYDVCTAEANGMQSGKEKEGES